MASSNTRSLVSLVQFMRVALYAPISPAPENVRISFACYTPFLLWS